MASKRTHTNSAEDSQVDHEDLIEKKLCTETERNKTKNVIYQLLPLVPGKPIRIEPVMAFSSQCYDEPCGSGAIRIVPSDPRLSASLTSELNIKEETTDGEPGMYFDDSILPDLKEEPIYEQKIFDNDCYVVEAGEEQELEEEELEEEENTKDNQSFEWRKSSCSMKSFLFAKEQKILTPIPKEPYELLRLFLDDELLDLIINETNKSVTKSETTWKPLTRDELIIFIGLIIHTGTISMHRLCDYWSNHYLFNVRSFSRFMKRNRFLQILDYLSFSSTAHHDDINRIQPVIDHFNKIMNGIYYPDANLIVAKSITIHGSNILLCEENRNKQRVTRIHMLAEPTGIVLKLNVTHGIVKYESVVMDLLAEKLDSGHSVYLNEKYNSLQTAFILFGRKTHCTGPLDDHFVHRMETPLRMIVTLDDLYKKNGSYYCDGIHLCRNDKQFYASSQYDGELLHVPTHRGRVSMKPKLVAMYDSVMNVDFNEFLMTYYPCRENTLTWYKKVFIHLLQLAIVNAYKFHGQTSRFYNFRLDILEKMLPAQGSHIKCSDTHILTKIEKFKMRKKRSTTGQMYVTKEVVRKECRSCRTEQRNKRTSTIYECRQCEGSPGYCDPCFDRVHCLDSSDKM